MTKARLPLRDCYFLGSARKDLSGFPDDVKCCFGHALHEAQLGLVPYTAKSLKGFGGRGVLELVENHDGNTFRAVYTVKFAEVIYVLHCFQKKSKRGIATPQHDLKLIQARLASAEAHHKARGGKGI